MEKMLKFDMHCHSKGVSLCAIESVEELIDFKISQGYDGLILTNHIQPWYFKEGEYPLLVQKQINEFHRALEYAKSKNFKVIFGCEVTINKPCYADILLYGINENFMSNSKDFCKMSQIELYKYCHERNVVLVQAHPYREGHQLLDLTYLDGVEINLATDLPYEDKIVNMDILNKLILTVGTDYHGGGNLIGGLYLPSDINNSEQLVKYLNSNTEINYFINDRNEKIKYGK